MFTMSIESPRFTRRLKRAVLGDLRTDRRLRFILLVTVFVAGFWFWWRIPNFASADEYGRLLRPMKAAGYFLADPSVDSFIRGATEGVASDASFYLYGILLIPVFILVLSTGQLDTFAGFASIESRFTLWHSVPEWYWTMTLVITRLVNVLFVVGIVYVTYRIGSRLRDRGTGHIAALLTALSLAVFQSAHEANEDTPMVLLLLVTLYLAIRYVQGEHDHFFFVACVLGGLAMAFKLTGGVVVVFLAVAFILRHAESESPLLGLWRPRLLVVGGLLGLAVFVVGKPNLLFVGPDWFTVRLSSALSGKLGGGGTSAPPMGYAAALAYLNGLGLALCFGVIIGLIDWARSWQRNDSSRQAELVLIAGLAVYLVVFLVIWQNFKTHHVLPSIPLLNLPLAMGLSRALERGSRLARVGFTVLLVFSVVYAGIGLFQYTNDSRDEAARWFQTEVDLDSNVLVYEHSVAHYGAVHGRPAARYDFLEEPQIGNIVENESDYTHWIVTSPDREPDYIVVGGGIRGSGKYPERAAFYDRLVNGDHFGYVVAAEFGQRHCEKSWKQELLYAGIQPRIEKRSSYQMILARNQSLA